MTIVNKQAVLDAIPMNWLDPLLTGPTAVIGKPPYDGHDIERLLYGVKERLSELVAAQASPEQRDRIVRWLRECQALLAEPTEVPELEALIATLVAAQASPPTAEFTEHCQNSRSSCADPHCRAHRGSRAVALSASRMIERHRPSLKKLADVASPPTPEAEKQQ